MTRRHPETGVRPHRLLETIVSVATVAEMDAEAEMDADAEAEMGAGAEMDVAAGDVTSRPAI